jgi:hypothetical protein
MDLRLMGLISFEAKGGKLEANLNRLVGDGTVQFAP